VSIAAKNIKEEERKQPLYLTTWRLLLMEQWGQRSSRSELKERMDIRRIN
jgi:hypothetical protein